MKTKVALKVAEHPKLPQALVAGYSNKDFHRRAVRECAHPEMVRIVDTGIPGRLDRPRYRLEIIQPQPVAR